MSDDTPIQEGFSTAGTVMVVLLLCSQLPAMYGVVFKGTGVDKLSPIPTVGQMGNFVSWVVYALVADEIALLRVNAIGVGFGVLYLSIFLVYTRGPKLRQLLVFLTAVLLGFALVLGLIVGVMSDHAAKVNALGWVALVCNTLMFAAPLASIKIALSTMDPAAIPILLTLAGTGCSILWGVYGWLKQNMFVFGPNAAGVALSALQIAIAAFIILSVRSRAGFQKVNTHGDALAAERAVPAVGEDGGFLEQEADAAEARQRGASFRKHGVPLSPEYSPLPESHTV
jgi:hypothetical protein